MRKFFTFIFALIGVVVTVAFIGLEIYVWFKYGKAPSGDIPAWALYLMFKW